MCKKRSTNEHWATYRNDGGTAKRMYMNLANAEGTHGSVWPTVATSSLITIGTAGDVNANAGTYVMWCWHSVDGYSKFGTYTGNGSTDGAFIYTGFSPAFLLVKKTNSSESWEMFDNTRQAYNPVNYGLFPDTNAAESSSRGGDFLSNGIKMRYANGTTNEDGHTYVYLAFAAYPFKYTNAR